MKKEIVILFICFIFLTACSKYSSKDVIHQFQKKLDGNSYAVQGNLSILNQDEVYHYDIQVSYQDGFYKVILINTANQHKQIILKNKDGVYVLTPALNKSFRFQSEWPYNHSQIYLLNSILNDLKKDKNVELSIKNNDYLLKSKVDYPNNHKFSYQVVSFSKSIKPKKVSVFGSDDIEYMTMSFDKVDYHVKYSDEDFSLEEYDFSEESNTTGAFEDIIYPMFLPEGTKLISEETIQKDGGSRVLMNYDGEKSFLLVEETVDVFDEFTVIPTNGEPCFFMDTIGVMTDNSLSWSSNGVDFYLISDVMSQDELLEVAQSITGVIAIK